jgi:dihydroorotate dehydrogenase
VSFRAIHFVLNVSLIPNLRALQDKKPLTQLLQTLQNKNLAKPNRNPILKIAPDLTDEQLLDIIDIVKQTQIAGVIATNTLFLVKACSLKIKQKWAGYQEASNNPFY